MGTGRAPAAVANLRRCRLEHGGPANAATVYGHHGSQRVCIRLAGQGRIWVYDPRWERA